jgi:hypothetical protein
MPISVQCGCGKALKVRDDLAGKKIKCPGCQAVVEVPAPGGGLEFAPEPEAPPRVCRQCGAENPSEQQTCISCSADLAPRPMVLPGGTPRPERIFKSEKAFEKPPPFPLIALGMYYRPHFILEYLRGWAQQPAILVQIILLYVGSLAAIGVVAAAGYLGPSDAPGAAPAVPEEADEYLQIRAGITPTLGIDVRTLPGFPKAGQPVRVRVRFTDAGKPIPASRLSAAVTRSPHQFFEDEAPKPAPAAAQAPPRKVVFEREENPQWWRAVFVAEEAGSYQFVLEPDPPLAGAPVAQFGLEVLPRPAESDTAVKVVTSVTRIVFAVLSSLIGLAISAGLINLASRIFGEGGEFLFLMIVLAFIESVVNVAQLGMLGIVPALGRGSSIFVGYAFVLWNAVLRMLAIMKVYEFDWHTAVATAAVAGIIQLWVVGLLVGSMLSSLGLM